MFHWKRGLALLLLSGAAFAASAAVAKKPTKKREVLVRAEHHNTQVARSWLKRMPTLRERVAQLVVIPFYGQAPNTRSKAWRDFVREVRDTRVGGLVIINRSQNGVVKNAEPYETAAFLNRMQRLAKTPLIVAGDFERGASMRMANTTKFPHLMAFGAAGDPELTRRLGQATARESRALGFQWIFAPVADVNSNPDNPIINIRSFGEDPRAVSEHVKAFIEGVHGGGKSYLLTTLKHFPGHGDTAVDSHLGLAKLDHSRTQMDSVELMPFRAGFQAGADQTYIVKRGDSLYGVASRHGVNAGKLAERNGLSRSAHLYAGQRLIIPSSGKAAARELPPAAPAVAAAEDHLGHPPPIDIEGVQKARICER